MNGPLTYDATPFEMSGTSAIAGSSEWLKSLATGSLTISLCILAIALVGLLMMGGRLPVRTGLRIVLGVFVLLGAPVMASALIVSSGYAGSPSLAMPQPRPLPEETRSLPASPWDPYAGASLRQD